MDLNNGLKATIVQWMRRWTLLKIWTGNHSDFVGSIEFFSFYIELRTWVKVSDRRSNKWTIIFRHFYMRTNVEDPLLNELKCQWNIHIWNHIKNNFLCPFIWIQLRFTDIIRGFWNRVHGCFTWQRVMCIAPTPSETHQRIAVTVELWKLTIMVKCWMH